MEGRGGKNKEEEQLPPGFRFHPTDEELIKHYLIKKITDAGFSATAMADVDLNKCEPWDLPGKSKMHGDKEWYFFSLRDRKYPTGLRTNRATIAGYWKTTGKDKEIFTGNASELLGMKKTLVFYKGRAPRGEKTNWVMHEYRLHSKLVLNTNNVKDEWVVCRVFKKISSSGKKFNSTSNLQARINSHGHFPIVNMCGLMQNEQYRSGASQTYLSNPNLNDFSSRFADRADNNGLLNNLVAAGNFGQSLASSLNMNMGASPSMMMSSAPFPGFTEGFNNVEANPTMGAKYHNNVDSCMELVEGYGWY